MTYSTALALFEAMLPAQQDAVARVFMSIYGAFPNVREAFTQAVADEALAIETEMLLLAAHPAAELLQ